MKRTSLLTKITIGLASVILATSCGKNADVPHSYQYSRGGTSKTLDLVANHWLQQGSEPIFMNSFAGVMALSNGSNVKVYMLTHDGDVLISSGSVSYLGGELWASTTTSDIVIYYRNFDQKVLPFDSLSIKVVFE